MQNRANIGQQHEKGQYQYQYQQQQQQQYYYNQQEPDEPDEDDFDEDDDFGDVDEHGDIEREGQQTNEIAAMGHQASYAVAPQSRQHPQTNNQSLQSTGTFGAGAQGRSGFEAKHSASTNAQSQYGATGGGSAFVSKLPRYRNSSSSGGGQNTNTQSKAALGSAQEEFLEKQRRMIENNTKQYSMAPPGLPTNSLQPSSSQNRLSNSNSIVGTGTNLVQMPLNQINNRESNDQLNQQQRYHQYGQDAMDDRERSEEEPQQENSHDNGYDQEDDGEPHDQAIEGTKDFNRAYDKLVKKFYNEEGANLLIPQEDMAIHEYQQTNRVKVDVGERQRRIEEQLRKKEEKIRQAQWEKEQKELEECSFAPAINRRKPQRAGKASFAPVQVGNARRGSRQRQSEEGGDGQLLREQDEGSQEEYDDESPEVRDIDTFVADQNRFLQQKRAKEELRKAQLLEEEQKMKAKVPKLNKKSMQLLQQRQERLEMQRLQDAMAKQNLDQVDEQQYPMTARSRLKQPTSLSRQRPPSSGPAPTTTVSSKASRQKFDSNEQRQDFKPKINKNTEKMIQNRNKRIEDNQNLGSRTRAQRNASSNGPKTEPLNQFAKPSDKYLLQKFNREFDNVKNTIIDASSAPNKRLPPKIDFYLKEQEQEQQQFSPSIDRRSQEQLYYQSSESTQARGAPLNYLKFKDLLVKLGLLTDIAAMQQESQEREKLYDLWKILKGEEQEAVFVESLRVLVQVLLRLIDAKRVVNVPDSQNQDGQRSENQAASDANIEQGDIGFYNSRDEFCVRVSEVQKIQRHFNVFYLNRLQFNREMQGKQLDQKKDQKAKQVQNQNSFKPKIEKSSQILADQRKKKVAEKLGMGVDRADAGQMAGDRLRAQGNLMNQAKELRAQKVIAAQMAKDCTFAPQTNASRPRPKQTGIVLGAKPPSGRVSTGSINLGTIAKKKDEETPQSNDPFQKATEPPQTGAAKYDQLYKLRKRQLDKTDKSKEDYEFERHGQECTFAPQLNKNPKYVRPQKDRPMQAPVPTNTYGQGQLSAEERKLKFEQKQLERMQKAREEKQRKAEMFDRGIPKAKPLSQTQLDEQQAVKARLQERREQQVLQQQRQEQDQQVEQMALRASRSSSNILSPGAAQSAKSALRSSDVQRSSIDNPNQSSNYNYDQNQLLNDQSYRDDEGPMSLTIDTRQHHQQDAENAEFERQEKIIEEAQRRSREEQEVPDQLTEQVVRNSLGIFSEEQYLRPSEAEDRDDEQEAEAEDEEAKGAEVEAHNAHAQGEEEESDEDDDEVQPLLFVDINLGGDEQERIVVFEGDTAPELAKQFCLEHNLDEETQEKLQELLEQQMAGVLPKIDEDEYGSEGDEEER